MIRNLYRFRINVYPKTKKLCDFKCYPLDRYRDSQGRRGKVGVLANEIYCDRRALFYRCTHALERDSGAPATYSGNAFMCQKYHYANSTAVQTMRACSVRGLAAVLTS